MSRHLPIDDQRPRCPVPVIRVPDAVQALTSGDLSAARCTDPGVLQAIAAWCRINGHEVVGTESLVDDYCASLRVGRTR